MQERSDQAVLREAVSVVEALRERVRWYAGDFSPIRTDQLAELLQRSSCFLHLTHFPQSMVDGGDIAFVAPAIRGINAITVDRGASRVDRQLAIRHELAHVARADVEEITYMTERDYRSHGERVADLVALADLVPARIIAFMRKRRVPWRAVLEEVQGAIETYASSWTSDRVEDRAALRVALYRERAI